MVVYINFQTCRILEKSGPFENKIQKNLHMSKKYCTFAAKRGKVDGNMENNLQYSIIYADIRPEIQERLSLGILTNKNYVYDSATA